MKVLLGISGASGAVYGVRTAGLLLSRGVDLRVVVTATAWGILSAELGGGNPPESLEGRRRWLARLAGSERPFRLHEEDDFSIPCASGSNAPDAVVVAPCSMGMLGRIAHGVASSALARCADVALKERKTLVLVPRETPLSAIHLENMLTLSRAGAVVLPACPGFYHRPTGVGDLVDYVADRILAHVGIDAGLLPRWGEPAGAAAPRRRKRKGEGG